MGQNETDVCDKVMFGGSNVIKINVEILQKCKISSFLFGLFLVATDTSQGAPVKSVRVFGEWVCRTPVRRRVRIHAFCTHFANSYGVEKRANFALFLLYKRVFWQHFAFYTYCTNWKFKIVQLYNSEKSEAKILTMVTKYDKI